jgi:hypothetical protein
MLRPQLTSDQQMAGLPIPQDEKRAGIKLEGKIPNRWIEDKKIISHLSKNPARMVDIENLLDSKRKRRGTIVDRVRYFEYIGVLRRLDDKRIVSANYVQLDSDMEKFVNRYWRKHRNWPTIPQLAAAVGQWEEDPDFLRALARIGKAVHWFPSFKPQD